MISLRDMPNSMFAVYGTDHELHGKPVERRMICGCGSEFTQMLMAARELEALARMGHLDSFLRQIPDAFVPVHCPKCERHQLTLQARLDEARWSASPIQAGTFAMTYPDGRDVA